MKFHHVTWRSFTAALYVTHALCVASSACSFSIVPWTLFRPRTLYRPWTPWSMHLKKLSNIYLQKCSENLNRLDKTIPKIYICWGIVGDTNFTNFHPFSPIFMAYYWPALRDDSKTIYMLGSNPNFSFAHLNWAKLGTGGGSSLDRPKSWCPRPIFEQSRVILKNLPLAPNVVFIDNKSNSIFGLLINIDLLVIICKIWVFFVHWRRFYSLSKLASPCLSLCSQVC